VRSSILKINFKWTPAENGKTVTNPGRKAWASGNIYSTLTLVPVASQGAAGYP